MTQRRTRLTLATAAALIGLAAAGEPASAQSAAIEADANEDEDVVVTARRKEEALQDVPLAVTAIGETEIRNSGIDNVADLALLTPGFSFRQAFGRSGGGQGGASVRPSIRGMSSILGAPNSAFFVDGVFVSGNITSYQLDNLERVEVIRGPQSALFGRQSFSGAINFVTRDPGDELSGRVTGTVGQFDHVEVAGYVSGPIAPDLAGELNGRIYSFGGDWRNQDNGKRDIGAQQSVNIGAKLVWTPAANFKATFNIGASQDRDKSFAYAFQGSDKLNCFLPRITGTLLGIPRSATQSRGYFCGEIGLPRSFAWNTDELTDLGFDGVEREALRSSFKVEWEMPGGFNLVSTTAYNTSENVSAFDSTLLPSRNPTFSIGGSSTSDFSQDLRLISPQDARFRVQIGAYYYAEEDGEGFSFNQSTRAKTISESDNAVTNVAGYGMVEFDLTERLTLTGEIRQQSEEIEATGLFTPGVRPGVRSVTYDATLPRITARYLATDDLTFYAAAAKGNKPGGFNDFPTDMLLADQQGFDGRGFSAFEEEEAWSYELGAKGKFRSVNFAAAAFYTDWKQQQLTRSEPYELFLASDTTRRTSRTPRAFATTPFIINAGESEITGGEIELFGEIAQRFAYRFGYAYANAEFVEFFDENTEETKDTDGFPSSDARDRDGATGQLAGNKLPQTPEHMLNASGTYRLPVRDGLEWLLRADYAYESKRYVQADNLAWVGESHNLNLRTGFETDRWSFTIFYNNALEDETPLVVTRLLDFNRTLLIADPVRRFAGQPLRFTFFRDFTVSGPRKPQAGINFSVKF
jgi:outer membrane receptor protein involved in Fe transport